MAQVVDDEAQMARNSAARNFFAAIEKATKAGANEKVMVACDCEGVRLSRLGTIEIVSLYFPYSVDQEEVTFLVDMKRTDTAHSSFRRKRIAALKVLLECETVTKVIHDCRKDSDALYHLEAIKLTNVHDTSCFHNMIRGGQNANLNEVLRHNMVGVNATRDNSIYNKNPTFWATRPLTSKMIQWASADVDKLTVVANKQLLELERSEIVWRFQGAKEISDGWASLVRDMKVERFVPLHMPIGQFIGPRGSNINDVKNSTGTMIYQDHDARGHPKDWVIYYPNTPALKQAKRRMGH